MTVDEYVRGILAELPRQLKDAFDPQRVQTVLAARISDNYGAKNRTPKYPRNPQGDTLQYVTGNLFKAATVYKASGNVSRTIIKSNAVTFEWGVDLAVIPYARIHEYGGQTGRNHAATMPPRPYIGPAMKAFQDDDMGKIVDLLFTKLLRGK
jgi:phage gpG-like protein